MRRSVPGARPIRRTNESFHREAASSSVLFKSFSGESAQFWLTLDGMAVRICLGQLKRYACGYLERVSAGETLEIVRRGRLVAFMVPPFSEPPSDGDRIGAAEPPAPNAKIPLSQLRHNAAPYFDRVAAGNIIDVVRHGSLVARIVAASSLP